MQFKLQQAQKLSQQMVITPQLQQAIKLLQKSHQEMAEELQQELLENPMLEESHEQDDFDLNNVSMEDFISGQGEEAKGKDSDATPLRLRTASSPRTSRVTPARPLNQPQRKSSTTLIGPTIKSLTVTRCRPQRAVTMMSTRVWKPQSPAKRAYWTIYGFNCR